MNPWVLDPLHISVRLLLALVLGGLIGYERERNSSAAGFRTHILVCLGSALIMLLSAYGFAEFAAEPNVRMDPARLAAQVISGIGFLGAGTIIRNGLSITGLTTAASLWVVAAIGLAAGAGFYYPAILTTGMVLASLWVLSIVEKRYFHRKRVYSVKVVAVRSHGVINQISSILERKGIDILRLVIEEDNRRGETELEITFSLKLPKRSTILPIITEISRLPNVESVSVE